MSRWFLVLAAAAVLAGSSGALAAQAAEPAPVPSLTPAATDALWSELVAHPQVQARAAAASADCAPVRVVFYAATDWLRLTTKLAANGSPCAQYFVSVPPLTADKSQPRADQAWRIRALGPAFHALAEISVAGWTTWVTSNGGDWYAAGVEARRRMAAAGYDVAAGDTWVVNEFSSAVRQGAGAARANMRAFVHGLYDGDGTSPAARGAVFVVGIGQSTADLSTYQARLEDWYEDGPFWADMRAYVSDWSQEVYGDVRDYADAAAPRDTRRDALNQYLQHPTALAAVAPADAAAAARMFLADTYSPLANAAWQYDSAFGWTDVPVDLMEDYVSAQVYAARYARNAHFGFAWAPKNLDGMPGSDFAAQSATLLDRLAAAIVDSAAEPAAACGTAWCAGTLAGAALTSTWSTFATWKPSQLAFTSAAQTLAPGAASAPMTIELETSSGVPYAAGTSVAVDLSSSSPTGELAASADGPWSPTLTLAIVSGATAASFYFRDAAPGSPTVTASAAGKTGAVQAVTVTAPPVENTPPMTPPVTPPVDAQPVAVPPAAVATPPAAAPVAAAQQPAQPATPTATVTPNASPPLVREPASAEVPLALVVLRPKHVLLRARRPVLALTTRLNRAATLTLTLRNSRGRRVAGWRRWVPKGVVTLSLPLPAGAREPGRDKLLVTAAGAASKLVPVVLEAQKRK